MNPKENTKKWRMQICNDVIFLRVPNRSGEIKNKLCKSDGYLFTKFIIRGVCCSCLIINLF